MIENILVMAGSVVTILTGGGLAARYLIHRINARFDAWTEAVIDNSEAMRHLTDRVSALERTMGRA